MKRLAAFTVLLVVLAAPACTVYDERLAAAKRGDYATALREWRPLAEQGYAKAQFNLGVMSANHRAAPPTVHTFKVKSSIAPPSFVRTAPATKRPAFRRSA